MAKPPRAIEYLAQPGQHPPRPACVIFGEEPFLRRQSLLTLRAAVLGGDEGDFSLSAFEGRSAELRDVLDDLSTVAMFGSGKRLVVVEEADEFVTRYRAQLEDYVARPVATGVLALDLKTFPSNTRLYKAIAGSGLMIDCSPPPTDQITRWLAARAKQLHQVQLALAAAGLLVEMVGPELGLLDQELSKLALLVGDDKTITAEMVSRLVGGWRARTAWEMLDTALDGDAGGAMLHLERLLAAGEQPIAVLGQISASLRRLAAATRLVLQAEAAGRKIALPEALERAGLRPFLLSKAERQLRRLGRHRGARLYRWLLEADLDLKGASAVPPRLILERLIVRLGAAQDMVGSRRIG
jgi:DNA polymerase-3 subunit delta